MTLKRPGRMILVLVACVSFCILPTHHTALAQNLEANSSNMGATDPESCAILGDPFTRVKRDETIATRIPSAVGMNVSDRCTAVQQSRIAQWRADDGSAWTQVRNRYCSAALGWVEYHPGTCQAGGPPPICPANHWHKDPTSAIDQLRKFAGANQNVRQTRAEELARLQCQCSVEDAKLADAHASRPRLPRVPGLSSDPGRISLRCTSDKECQEIAPGYTCVEGFCQLPISPNRDLDEPSDEVIKHIVEEQHTGLSGLFSDLWVQVALGVMKPTLLSTFSDSYVRHRSALLSLVNEIPRDISTMRSASVNSSEYTDTRVRLDDIHGQILELIKHLNEDKQGIIMEREFGNQACYDMLSYEHEKVLTQTANLASYLRSLR